MAAVDKLEFLKKWKFTTKQTGIDAKKLHFPRSPFNKRFKNPNCRKINIKGTTSNTNFK